MTYPPSCGWRYCCPMSEWKLCVTTTACDGIESDDLNANAMNDAMNRSLRSVTFGGWTLACEIYCVTANDESVNFVIVGHVFVILCGCGMVYVNECETVNVNGCVGNEIEFEIATETETETGSAIFGFESAIDTLSDAVGCSPRNPRILQLSF